MASFKKLIEEAKDSIEARRSRQYWHSMGIFPHLGSYASAGDDGEAPGVPVLSLATALPDGSKSEATDYAMKWKDFRKPDYPSTTHEICLRGDFVYVSGQTVNMIARIWKEDPEKQVLFEFPEYEGYTAQPHTLRFAPKVEKNDDFDGLLFVGLEEQGRIVTVDIDKIMRDHGDVKELENPIKLREKDFEQKWSVRLSGGLSTPLSINTRPHGFCWDAKNEYIWFTGKLTNTVGRLNLYTSDLQHFELKTLGAVPIYLALGPDDQIWGTCLSNNTIFRVTTGRHPVVHELTISNKAMHERPIAIKPDPTGNYMWFSTEAGHNVCRVDIDKFNEEFPATSTGKGKAARKNAAQCVCSVGCENLFRGSLFTGKIITEFPVPKMNHNMLLAGLAVTPEGDVWTQSYMDTSKNELMKLPDYVIKIEFSAMNPIDGHVPFDEFRPKRKRTKKLNTTGVPIHFFQVPTLDTGMHRITPDGGTIWYTELTADKVGVLRFEDASGKPVFRKRAPTSSPPLSGRKKKRRARKGGGR